MGKELLGAYRESIVEMSAEVCLVSSSSFFFLDVAGFCGCYVQHLIIYT